MLDLIIRNARTIEETIIEIGIEKGKITQIAPEIKEDTHEELILDEGQYISAGWIDDHVHCFQEMELYYDYPDQVGVSKGVTTIIDAGTTGAENIHRFHAPAQEAKTSVFALLNISKYGIVEQDELADLSKVEEALVKKTIDAYPDFIVGIKARMSRTVIGQNGIKPLLLAKQIQMQNRNLPLMCHIGSAPPELTEILEILEHGDVLTHFFNGKPNGLLDTNGEMKAISWDAYKKGVIFDIGHGTDSFNFHVAETAFKEKMKAHMISTDIYIRNREKGPVYDMATTMEKLFVVGYSWKDIIDRVTINPAEHFNLNRKGQLKKEYDADMTIF